VACAGESGSEPADPTVLSPGETQGTVTVPPDSSGVSGGAVVPTTVDLDGRVPDAIEPPDPSRVPTTAVPTPSATRTALPGFGEVLAKVHTTDGRTLEWCLLLAETAAQEQRGLMEVTDPQLGGYSGMLFRFANEVTGGFYMRNTPQPLSIVYLDGSGGVVSITEMAPCEDVEGCQSYPADGPFQRTIEVPTAAGGVAALGIEPGATVEDTGQVCPA
jgi:uncharacterized membrane protein (UPF0127 family)